MVSQYLIIHFYLFSPPLFIRYYSAVRFKSSRGDDLQLKENCDVSDQFQRRCSASNSHAWLIAQHPNHTTVDGGVHVNELCMRTGRRTNMIPFDLDFCTCDRRQMVLIQRCVDTRGGSDVVNSFFVYRLTPLFPSGEIEKKAKECTLRYCVTEKRQGNIYRCSVFLQTIECIFCIFCKQ